MHLTQRQLSEYANQQLSALELLSVDDHLAHCVDCCKNLVSVLQAKPGGFAAVNPIVWGLTATDEDVHLGFSQIVGYLDQQLEPIEYQSVVAHLQDCQTCHAEVEDLQSFKLLLSLPAVTNSVQNTATISRWRERMSSLRHNAWWLLLVGIFLEATCAALRV